MSKIEYTPEFEALWEIYPKRAGGNPKRKAFMAFQKRTKEGYEYDEIKDGLIRYATFCEKTAKIGSEFVMQAATFFGLNECFLEDWELPNQPAQKQEWEKLPFLDDDLQPFAEKHGFSRPSKTDTYAQYRSKLQSEIRQRQG